MPIQTFTVSSESLFHVVTKNLIYYKNQIFKFVRIDLSSGCFSRRPILYVCLSKIGNVKTSYSLTLPRKIHTYLDVFYFVFFEGGLSKLIQYSCTHINVYII